MLRTTVIVIALMVICVSGALILRHGFRRDAERQVYRDLLDEDAAAVAIDPQMESRIKAFCSDCHALPLAENYPRDRWHFEVKKGYEFYAKSGRRDLDPPPLHLSLAYFRGLAPEQPVFSPAAEGTRELSVEFNVEHLVLDSSAGVLPEIAHLHWTDLAPSDNPVLLACDMRYGQVVAISPRNRRSRLQLVARLSNPCHVEPCDLDGDGATDLVVADLGGYRPSDHQRGQVILLTRRPETDEFEAIVLASGLGRVADVRPADVDGDQDVDLIVAEFGWYRTGGIVLLRNVSQPGRPLQFEPERLDMRPGTIHVPIHDFDGDGRQDFAALVSQEYESVDLFVNAGGGRFDQYNLWAAPDLTFGLSGMELVDLDGDGDMDLLLTNGDAWDYGYASPSHGVQWLENRGRLEFAYHRLADMPGAYRALAGDIDRDGDQDLLVAAWLPPDVKPRSLMNSPSVSIACLEQTQPGVFVRHTLETGSPNYAALEMADFDGDGDLDFAVGSGPYLGQTSPGMHYLALWWNQAAPATK